jgi:hypothetical protein
MLLTITHLKAPWPQGAVVGDVIDLLGVPSWALGKCTAAPDGAVVTIAQPAAEQPAEQQEADKPRRGRPRKADQ